MISDFRAFLLRGNVVDLAVGVVIGAAFGTVVTSLVADLITPVIAAVGGTGDFSSLSFTVGEAVFRYGNFINALVAFLMIAAAVFFLVVRPVNHLMARFAPAEPDDLRDCPECLSRVPKGARRCAACTSEIAAAP